MKDVPQDLKNIFFIVRDLVKDQIVNIELTKPIELDTLPDKTIESVKEFLYQENQDYINYKIHLARFFVILTTLIVIEMNSDSDQEDPSTLLKPIMHSIGFMMLLTYYEMKIGSIPFAGNFNKLILPKKEYEKQQRYTAFEYAKADAKRKSPFNGLSLIFAGKKLNQMFEIRSIKPMIHDSIVVALSALKHKSFDCVGVTAIVLLKLIEQNVPYTLKWYYKPGNSYDGHNFIIATKNQDSFIIDPWYDVFTDAARISDNNFLLQYPLLTLDDKVLIDTITPDHFAHYQGYIQLLNETMPKNTQGLSV